MANQGRPIERGKRRTPSQVRNMLETRVRKLAASYGVDEQIAAAEEMILVLQDFLAERRQLRAERDARRENSRRPEKE
jgi:hypothetical protein